MAKFPFWSMDYSPWSSRYSIDRNRLKKFMQVEINVECMHTNFGGRGFSSICDILHKSFCMKELQFVHIKIDRIMNNNCYY